MQIIAQYAFLTHFWRRFFALTPTATCARYVNCDDDNDYDDVPDDGVLVPVDKQVLGWRTISGQPALGRLELARRRDVVDEVLEVCRHVGLLPALVVEDETQLRLALVVEAADELQRLSTHRPHTVQRPRDARQQATEAQPSS